MANKPRLRFPLHPSQESRLNPQYKAFYNKVGIDTPPLRFFPIEMIRSVEEPPFPGCGPDVPVGKKEDMSITPDAGPAKGVTIPMRCYTPPGLAPKKGWPVVVMYHGGGWVVGGLATSTDIVTNICTRAKCVVVSVDYRQIFPDRSSLREKHTC